MGNTHQREPSIHTRIGSLRTLAGVGLVPPTAGLVAIPMYGAMSSAGLMPPRARLDSFDAALGLGSGVALLAVLITVFCALPALGWLSERRRLSFGRLLALGAALGNVPFALIVAGVVAVHVMKGTFAADIGQYWYGAAGATGRVAMGFTVGICSAAVFWFVAIEGNRSWDSARR